MGWNSTAEWKSALDNIGMTDFFKDTQIPESLDQIMSNGNWEVIFHQFAGSEYATENLDFLRAVATFESSGSLDQAAEIYKEFVPEGSPRQVNLPGGVRTDLEGIFGEGGSGFGPPNLFDSAKNEVQNLLRRDTFPRFRTSAVAAQTEMGQETDWDNIEGRERS
jgi:hypothetical protein